MRESSWPDAIFLPHPVQWGLRGDPYLWEELRTALARHPRPVTSDDLRELLLSQIEALLGCSMVRDQYIHFERFAHGGMSSGKVSVEWWIDNGIPELLRRFALH